MCKAGFESNTYKVVQAQKVELLCCDCDPRVILMSGLSCNLNNTQIVSSLN